MSIVDAAARTKAREDISATMRDLGVAARIAATELALAPRDLKDAALNHAAEELRRRTSAILEANKIDLAAAEAAGQTSAFIDRLTLRTDRIEAIAASLEAIAELPDPVGRVLDEWTRPNGLNIQRVAVPLGVIGIIYESRPNVTADAGALCLKSGNAAILRGGSDSFESSAAIHAALEIGLASAGLPTAAIQRVPVRSRDAVGLMLAGLDGNIDVIVPRGGKSLVARVERDARVPVFSHLEGICHIYVDAGADLEKAIALTVNAKMRRTGICGAAETLLVDRSAQDTHLEPLIKALLAAGCSVRGDQAAQNADTRVKPAIPEDWDTEYLDATITVGLAEGVQGAISHIAAHGSNHTDAIVTEDQVAADRFLREVDSAIVLHNASTQFADGGEFGFGAEIGIATGKMHARGPVGLEQLTSFKYVVRGQGQTRP